MVAVHSVATVEMMLWTASIIIWYSCCVKYCTGGGYHHTQKHLSVCLYWLVGKLIYTGKPLASGYYSRHPKRTQYNKKKEARQKRYKAGEN